MSKRFKILSLENEPPKKMKSDPASPQNPLTAKKFSLSRLQAMVSLAAGLVSITSALIAIPNLFKTFHGRGELTVIIQDARTGKGLPNATIEILSLQGTLLETLTPNAEGEAVSKVNEGRFRLHVSHPQFPDQNREFQISSSKSTEVRVQMRTGTSLPRTIKRFFGQ
ncbi:MAG: carboxypeptidase regulatory-like domain-containing protein [Terriglobia bacterium]